MGQGTSFGPTGGPRHTGKQIIVTHCPHCNGYLQPPFTWVNSTLGPEELLKSSVRSMKNSDSVQLGPLQTKKRHPRCKLIEVTIQKHTVAEIVEFLIEEQYCESCSKGLVTRDDWVVTLHLRHRVPHKKRFHNLLLALYKSRELARVSEIRHCDQGLDIFFEHPHYFSLHHFLDRVLPLRSVSVHPKGLAGGVPYGGYAIYSLEISAMYVDHLILLHRPQFRRFGPLAICTKFAGRIDLLDPLTLKQLTNVKHMQRFTTLFSSSQLVEYRVVNVEIVCSEDGVGNEGYVLADAQVKRVSEDSNGNDNLVTVRTHLGRGLNPGDYALGYDLHGLDKNNVVGLNEYTNLVLPDVVLIKKGRKEPEYSDLDVDRAAKRTKISNDDKQSTRDPQDHPDLWVNKVVYRRDLWDTRECYWDDLTSHKLEKFLFDVEQEKEEVEGKEATVEDDKKK